VPKFLLFMSDEHNPKISSVYGHPFVRTPNMERLARLGTVYEYAYCPSPLCVPSRSAFMSGLPVHRIQAYNNFRLLAEPVLTFAECLSRQGVHTVHVGNGANLFRGPDTLGFDEMLAVKYGNERPSKEFARSPFPARKGGKVSRTGWGPREDAWSTDIMQVDAALEWLETKGARTESDWFLSINVSAPHFPVYARPEYWEMYEELADLPVPGREAESANHPYALDLRSFLSSDEVSDDEARAIRQGYFACVTFVDHQLGRVLDALERLGLLDETVVAYTSDHGDMLGKFGLWRKMSLYEDSVRIPLIVAGPGFAEGKRVRTPVSLLDFQAAIFRALERERPAEWWGEPLQDVSGDDETRAVFAEYHGPGVRSGAFMIRRGDWKLIYYCRAPHQLFNLAEDPDELENLWEKRPDVALELERELRSLCDPDAENERAHEFEAKLLSAADAMEG